MKTKKVGTMRKSATSKSNLRLLVESIAGSMNYDERKEDDYKVSVEYYDENLSKYQLSKREKKNGMYCAPHVFYKVVAFEYSGINHSGIPGRNGVENDLNRAFRGIYSDFSDAVDDFVSEVRGCESVEISEDAENDSFIIVSCGHHDGSNSMRMAVFKTDVNDETSEDDDACNPENFIPVSEWIPKYGWNEDPFAGKITQAHLNEASEQEKDPDPMSMGHYDNATDYFANVYGDDHPIAQIGRKNRILGQVARMKAETEKFLNSISNKQKKIIIFELMACLGKRVTEGKMTHKDAAEILGLSGMGLYSKGLVHGLEWAEGEYASLSL